MNKLIYLILLMAVSCNTLETNGNIIQSDENGVFIEVGKENYLYYQMKEQSLGIYQKVPDSKEIRLSYLFIQKDTGCITVLFFDQPLIQTDYNMFEETYCYK